MDKQFFRQCTWLLKVVSAAQWIFPAFAVLYWFIPLILPLSYQYRILPITSDIQLTLPIAAGALGLSGMIIVPLWLGCRILGWFLKAIIETPVFPPGSDTALKKLSGIVFLFATGWYLLKILLPLYFSFFDSSALFELQIPWPLAESFLVLVALMIRLFSWLFQKAAEYEQENSLTV